MSQQTQTPSSQYNELQTTRRPRAVSGSDKEFQKSFIPKPIPCSHFCFVYCIASLSWAIIYLDFFLIPTRCFSLLYSLIVGIQMGMYTDAFPLLRQSRCVQTFTIYDQHHKISTSTLNVCFAAVRVFIAMVSSFAICFLNGRHTLHSFFSLPLSPLAYPTISTLFVFVFSLKIQPLLLMPGMPFE